jgi:hypothetical protein
MRIKKETETEPNAILMAKRLKEKKQDKDKIDKERMAIEELERQGELKEDVAMGGEEFEDEEPRQG